MKKLLMVLFLFSCASFINAQWIVNGFENVAADTLFRHPPTPGQASGEGALTLTDLTTGQYDGTGALQCDYVVHSSESYGGYTQLTYQVPQSDSTYLDWSSAKALRLWYNVVTPANPVASVEFRMQIFDGGAGYWDGGGDHESWYINMGTAMYDDTPGWKSLIIPLTDLGKGAPNATGFSLPGWAGTENNGVLDLNKVGGYVLEWETPGIVNNGKGTGTIIFDKLEFLDTAYPPVSTFDSTAVNSFFALDNMSWAGAGNDGIIALTDVTDKPFEGYSSLKLDIKVNNSQSWGGYVNAQHSMPDGTFLPDLSANTDLVFFIKVLTPFTGADQRVTMRFFLYDGSVATEPWQMTVPVNLYQTSDWQMIKLRLESKGVGLSVLPRDGFTIPSWESGNIGDGNLNLDKIKSWKIEFSGSADAPYVQGEICEGSLMVDLLTPEGYRSTDVTAPPPPDGLLAVQGTYSNLVTWNDVPGESGEIYNVYYSENPIPNPIPDPLPAGVEVAKLAVPEGTSVWEQLLRSPNTDQSVSYYYAVNAVDKAGNVGEIVQTPQPITNMAKGVSTISLNAPTSTFVADGDLKEWAGITPIVMSVTDGSGTVAPNTLINGDADLKVTAYVAVDPTYLYVAFDIEDDVVVVRPESEIASYLSDCPDLFLGTYNWHGAPHGAYKRGATPDYHFRFSKNRCLLDGTNSDSLVIPGTADYFWGEKFPTGYTVEARISWENLAKKRNAGQTNFDDVFVPQEGMRIPIDFSINDNDDPVGSREGIMCYSPNNNDLSWGTTSRWLWTWIGNKWAVGVNDNKALAYSYALDQNYPNPFNPATQIKYSIEKPGLVSMKIYDVLGREVKELVNQFQSAGVYSVNFDASNLSSGIYLYQITSGQFQSAKKMMLVK
ncbi:MAG: T9SS type A sorting domain-containing protein [Ignavibacteriales bacterium]|nr:T9SS type A sorting domain-containing protein [Ignavibacteriales bacterium]